MQFGHEQLDAYRLAIYYVAWSYAFAKELSGVEINCFVPHNPDAGLFPRSPPAPPPSAFVFSSHRSYFSYDNGEDNAIKSPRFQNGFKVEDMTEESYMKTLIPHWWNLAFMKWRRQERYLKTSMQAWMQRGIW